VTVDEAYGVIVKHALYESVKRVGWEDYPEIGEYDWERIAYMIAVLKPVVDWEQFEEALSLLIERGKEHE